MFSSFKERYNQKYITLETASTLTRDPKTLILSVSMGVFPMRIFAFSKERKIRGLIYCMNWPKSGALCQKNVLFTFLALQMVLKGEVPLPGIQAKKFATTAIFAFAWLVKNTLNS